jgi:iron complex transport system ATP-binding protein
LATPLSKTTPYLEMQGVETWLGSRQVFQHLSLNLFKGEHTVILGPNGAGKSSLIRLLTRELYPVVQAGSWLRLFGSATINLWTLRSRMGVLPQDQHTTYRGDVRAFDVVLSGFFGSVGLGRSHEPDSQQRQRVADLMDQMELSDLQGEPFGCLSEGQRRRLLLARALVHDPEVLVLDEPTNGLDLQARYQLLNLLRQLCQRGTTLLLVTHRLEEVLPEIHRAVFLKNGTVVADGPCHALLADQPLSALFDTPLHVVAYGGHRQVLPGAGQADRDSEND